MALERAANAKERLFLYTLWPDSLATPQGAPSYNNPPRVNPGLTLGLFYTPFVPFTICRGSSTSDPNFIKLGLRLARIWKYRKPMKTLSIFLRYEAPPFSFEIRAYAPESQQRFLPGRVGIDPEGEFA